MWSSKKRPLLISWEKHENPLLQENLLSKKSVSQVLSTITRDSTIKRYTITRGDCIELTRKLFDNQFSENHEYTLAKKCSSFWKILVKIMPSELGWFACCMEQLAICPMESWSHAMIGQKSIYPKCKGSRVIRSIVLYVTILIYSVSILGFLHCKH